MKRIAALLTVHNRKEKTLRCLRELYSQELPDDFILSVYLTDDGCTDGTPEAIRQEFPQVHIVKGDGNLFWNRGMHVAWSEAEKNDYDFYLWLNDDTYLFDNAIINLALESNSHNDTSIIIGATVDSFQKKITYGGRSNGKLLTDLTNYRVAEYFNGNIVLIPKYVFEILGKNDPYYHHALGDFDYGFRAYKANIKCLVCQEPLGICDEHETIPKWKDKNYSLRDRWNYLYSSGGNGANPKEFFHYQCRHKGIFIACLTYLSNHIHVIFPSLWK